MTLPVEIAPTAELDGLVLQKTYSTAEGIGNRGHRQGVTIVFDVIRHQIGGRHQQDVVFLHGQCVSLRVWRVVDRRDVEIHSTLIGQALPIIKRIVEISIAKEIIGRRDLNKAIIGQAHRNIRVARHRRN